MNNSRIVAVGIITLLIVLPFWRVNQNAEHMADGVDNHLSGLGEWKHAEVQVGLDGKVTLSKVTFIPKGHSQGYQIQNIQIHSSLWDLLLKSPQQLTNSLPDGLTISFNGIGLNDNGQDLKQTIQQNNFWPVAANGLGILGCGQGDEVSFTDQQWRTLFPDGLYFNAEFTYRLVDNFHIDFNLNIDVEDGWFTTWSGTLARSSDLFDITFDDVIMETLYYYQADMGFNQRRNDMCARVHQDSFAAYRLASANQLQHYLKAQVAKDLPEDLHNMYQRSLAADTEINAIVKFAKPRYISEVAVQKPGDLLLSSSLEVALGENDYTAVELTAIDHLDLSMDLLKNQLEAQNKRKQDEAEKNKQEELIKTVKTQIGGPQRTETQLSDWSEAVGKQVNIKTKRGRPVFGKLIAIDSKVLTISTRYMQGNATLSIPRDEVLSVSLSR